MNAQIVIAGGGIVGASVAYHLAKLGRRDIVLLEQGRLTCGTTWHAAGLVGQMRPNRSMTRMSQYGIELYSTLERETGLALYRELGPSPFSSGRRPLYTRPRNDITLAT